MEKNLRGFHVFSRGFGGDGEDCEVGRGGAVVYVGGGGGGRSIGDGGSGLRPVVDESRPVADGLWPRSWTMSRPVAATTERVQVPVQVQVI